MIRSECARLCAAGRAAVELFRDPLDCGYRADIIVDDNVILELKSVEHILPLHEANSSPISVSADAGIGLLLNFNTLSLKDSIRRRIL